MKIRFTKAPTFTKAITASAVFAIAYLASTSSLPSVQRHHRGTQLGGECLERQSLLHTASGWLALVCLAAAVLLLTLRHKDSIAGWWQASVQQALGAAGRRRRRHTRRRRHKRTPPVPAPVPGRAPGFCAACGTRIIAGDRFCQGCGSLTGFPGEINPAEM